MASSHIIIISIKETVGRKSSQSIGKGSPSSPVKDPQAPQPTTSKSSLQGKGASVHSRIALFEREVPHHLTETR